MKTNPLIFYIAFLLLGSCCGNHAPGKPQEKSKIVFTEGKWETFVLGDINGDAVIDTAFVYTPPYYSSTDADLPEMTMFDSCVNHHCYNKVRFSLGLPGISIENSLWGTVEAIEDLDEDGIRELVFQTNWFIGNHVTIEIYSFDQKDRKWVVLADNWLYQQDSYRDRIRKIDKEKFRFKIEYMDSIEDYDVRNKDIVVKISK